ncbi:MAG: hypothetical protein MZV65_52630 [Chromatiales bacterium]|nr:hypothetical protein [Chromatiales bacterium]
MTVDGQSADWEQAVNRFLEQTPDYFAAPSAVAGGADAAASRDRSGDIAGRTPGAGAARALRPPGRTKLHDLIAHRTRQRPSSPNAPTASRSPCSRPTGSTTVLDAAYDHAARGLRRSPRCALRPA